MRIKFTARHMPKYVGNDGTGKTIELKPGDIAEVSDAVGKMLCAKYHHNFEEIKDESKEEKPSKSDKKQRKVAAFRAK